MHLPFQDTIQTYLKKRKKNVPEWKKKYAELQKQFTASELERETLYSQVQNWKVRSRLAHGVIESIMDEGIKWFDPTTLGVEGERRYRMDAKIVLENRTFQNEINKMEADMVKWSVLQSKDFDDIRDIRHQLSGIKLIRERLEELQKFIQ